MFGIFTAIILERKHLGLVSSIVQNQNDSLLDYGVQFPLID